MQQRYRRSAALFLVLCAGGVIATSCGSGSSSPKGAGTSGSAGAGGLTGSSVPSCTDAWCPKLTPHCERMYDLCVLVQLGANNDKAAGTKMCIDDTGYLIHLNGRTTSPEDQIQELATCMATAKTCDDVLECQTIVAPNYNCPEHPAGGEKIPPYKDHPKECDYQLPCGCVERCYQDPDEGRWECQPPDKIVCPECEGMDASTCFNTKAVVVRNPVEVCSGPAPVAQFPPGAVWQTGDDPVCVTCAFDKCKAESKLCFVDAESTPECYPNGGTWPDVTPDCCATLRDCIGGCDHNGPNDPNAFEVCSSQCDDLYPQGTVQYQTYQTCMAAQCADCGNHP